MDVTILLVALLVVAAQNVVLSVAMLRSIQAIAAQPRGKPDVTSVAPSVEPPVKPPAPPLLPDELAAAFAMESEPWAYEGLQRRAYELYATLNDWSAVEQTLRREGELEAT